MATFNFPPNFAPACFYCDSASLFLRLIHVCKISRHAAVLDCVCILTFTAPDSACVCRCAYILWCHGNPSVSTAPVGWTVVSFSHRHKHTHIHTQLEWRGQLVEEWGALTGGVGWGPGAWILTGLKDPCIFFECPHGTNETLHCH